MKKIKIAATVLEAPASYKRWTRFFKFPLSGHYFHYVSKSFVKVGLQVLIVEQVVEQSTIFFGKFSLKILIVKEKLGIFYFLLLFYNF